MKHVKDRIVAVEKEVGKAQKECVTASTLVGEVHALKKGRGELDEAVMGVVKSTREMTQKMKEMER